MNNQPPPVVTELLPCPFCQAVPKPNDGDLVVHHATNCFFDKQGEREMWLCGNRKIESWNTRHSPTTPPEPAAKDEAWMEKAEDALKKARHALTWSKPEGGESCNGTITDEQAGEWFDEAVEALDEVPIRRAYAERQPEPKPSPGDLADRITLRKLDGPLGELARIPELECELSAKAEEVERLNQSYDHAKQVLVVVENQLRASQERERGLREALAHIRDISRPFRRNSVPHKLIHDKAKSALQQPEPRKEGDVTMKDFDAMGNPIMTSGGEESDPQAAAHPDGEELPHEVTYRVAAMLHEPRNGGGVSHWAAPEKKIVRATSDKHAIEEFRKWGRTPEGRKKLWIAWEIVDVKLVGPLSAAPGDQESEGAKP